MKALRTTAGLALCVWWLPTLVLAFAPPALRSAGYAYRRDRVRRLMETGDLDEAGRVIGRLRREVEAFRQRVIQRSTVEPR